MKRICVYCGSNPGRDSRYVEGACALVREMTVRNIGLVYGGASIGIMGVTVTAHGHGSGFQVVSLDGQEAHPSELLPD